MSTSPGSKLATLSGMNARLYSATLEGIDGKIIEIEAASQRAIPKIQITGLPGDIVKESRERVQACLNAMGFDVPSSRVVVHLSPATAKKQGSQFDLPISVAVLVAEGLLRAEGLARVAFLGELSLDGRVKKIAYLLPLLECLEKWEGIDRILIPVENEAEASLLQPRKTWLVSNLGEVIDHLSSKRALARASPKVREEIPVPAVHADRVQGQGFAKRALQVALAGRHHLLMIGPPGVGKSMLAHCTPDLLPPLSNEEAVQSAKLMSLSAPEVSYGRAPFRAPHHTISAAGLLGGGSGMVVPGEVTFAHFGALFLDEFPEFSRPAIEGLREPLQNGSIQVHRVGAHFNFPARFTLLVAMNPCPCGYFFSTQRRCACTLDQVANYRRRVSGPLLDRFDMLVMMGAGGEAAGPTAETLKKGITCAVGKQRERHGEGRRNGDTDWVPELAPTAAEDWQALLSSRQWSYRAVSKLARVARTIADIDGCDEVSLSHLNEAKLLRCPDSLANYWR